MTSPNLRIPAEWDRQKAIWTAWPADPAEWNGDLQPPRADVARLVKTLSASNKLRVLVNGDEARESAQAQLGTSATLFDAKYGDIWLRDTGPIFAVQENDRVALRFQTNSWGGKFELPDDARVGDEIARLAKTKTKKFDFVIEGGALDHDGAGTVLTTKQTLLNPNRNGWTQTQAEAVLINDLNFQKVIWIDEGLARDHTDGHIDNIARFVGPGCVVCQSPAGKNDPNADTLNKIADVLEGETDAVGRPLDVVRIPGVGQYKNPIGEVSPASHMNFVIANEIVVVPVYGTPTQEAALSALQDVFKDRKVIGLPSQGLLGYADAGGGSFHCITQQEPDV